MFKIILRYFSSFVLTIALSLLSVGAVIGALAFESGIHRTLWFELLLGLLAVQLVVLTATRLRGSLHRFYIVAIQFGILLLFTGFVLHVATGVSGQMTLSLGKSVDRISSTENFQLEIEMPFVASAFLPLQLERLPRNPNSAPFVADLPFNLGKIALLQFIPQAVSLPVLTKSEGEGLPALDLQISSNQKHESRKLWSGDARDGTWQHPALGKIQVIYYGNDTPTEDRFATNDAALLFITTPNKIFLLQRTNSGIRFDSLTVGQQAEIDATHLFTIDNRENNLIASEIFEPAPKGSPGETAIQFALIKPTGEESDAAWLTDQMKVRTEEPSAEFSLKPASHELGFAMVLQPGGDASEHSVQMIDPDGAKCEIKIGENRSFRHRGWKFTVIGKPDDRTGSIHVAVTHDNRSDLCYLIGSIVLLLGLTGFLFNPFRGYKRMSE